MPTVAKQVTFGAAMQLFDPTDSVGDKVSVTVQNLGPNPLYVASGMNNPTSTNAIQVPSGTAYTFASGEEEIWGRTTTADQVSPADTRVSRERLTE